MEEGAQKEEDSALTFLRVRELAAAVKEARVPKAIGRFEAPNGARPPRLTESWLCCAEPTSGQLRAV